MGFLKHFFNKGDDELSIEDKNKVNYILNENSQSIEVEKNNEELIKESINLEELVSKIEFSQINKLRNLLDKKELELSGGDVSNKGETDNEDNFSNVNEIEVNLKKNVGEVEIKEDIDDEYLNDETYELDGDFKEEVKEIEIKEEKNIQSLAEDVENFKKEESKEESKEEIKEVEKKVEVESSIKEENIKPVIEDDEFSKDFLNKIKDIFGRENIFSENSIVSSYELVNGIELLYIGIRNKGGFDNNLSEEEQNKWFIVNIKKVEELKNFKMLRSDSGVKDLIWERESGKSIFICYRSCEKLDDKSFFKFPLK